MPLTLITVISWSNFWWC